MPGEHGLEWCGEMIVTLGPKLLLLQHNSQEVALFSPGEEMLGREPAGCLQGLLTVGADQSKAGYGFRLRSCFLLYALKLGILT